MLKSPLGEKARPVTDGRPYQNRMLESRPVSGLDDHDPRNVREAALQRMHKAEPKKKAGNLRSKRDS